MSRTNPVEIQLPIPSIARERLFEVMEQVHSFSVHWLNGRKGEKAREHLYDVRKLNEEVVRNEGIGYIPASNDGRLVLRTAQRASILPEELLACGLATRNLPFAKRAFRTKFGRDAETSEELSQFFQAELLNNPEFYSDSPSFRMKDGTWRRNDHLVLPYRVRDEGGELRVASWKARTLAEEADSRYMALVDTAIFSQSDMIVGLPGFERDLEAWGEAIITEGEIDRISMMQALSEEFGPSHPPVLPMGNARLSAKIEAPADDLRDESIEEKVRRAGPCAPLVGKRIVLFIDDDKTGRRTALGNAALLSSIGCQVFIARASLGLPPVGERKEEVTIKDASDLLRHYGGRAVRRAYGRAHSYDVVDVEIERYLAEAEGRPKTLRARTAAAREFIEALLCVHGERRDDALRRVARVLDFEPEILQKELDRRTNRREAAAPVQAR